MLTRHAWQETFARLLSYSLEHHEDVVFMALLLKEMMSSNTRTRSI